MSKCARLARGKCDRALFAGGTYEEVCVEPVARLEYLEDGQQLTSLATLHRPSIEWHSNGCQESCRNLEGTWVCADVLA